MRFASGETRDEEWALRLEERIRKQNRISKYQNGRGAIARYGVFVLHRHGAFC